jgi:hypothetical protein
MIDTAKELADVYDQLRYNLEYSQGLLKSIDAIIRTLLGVEPLAESFRAKVADSQYLANTDEMLAQAALTLAAVESKAAHFRARTLQ